MPPKGAQFAAQGQLEIIIAPSTGVTKNYSPGGILSTYLGYVGTIDQVAAFDLRDFAFLSNSGRNKQRSECINECAARSVL